MTHHWLKHLTDWPCTLEAVHAHTAGLAIVAVVGVVSIGTYYRIRQRRG